MSDAPTTGGGNNAAFSEMLSGLLSNPDMMKKVGSIISSISAASSTESDRAPSVSPFDESPPLPTQSANAIPTAANPSPLMGGDGLSALLSDPSMLEKLPQILSVMKPLMASMPSPKQGGSEHHGKVSPQDQRNNLLLALKPFLSSERREAVDTIVRIAKLGSILEHLK